MKNELKNASDSFKNAFHKYGPRVKSAIPDVIVLHSVPFRFPNVVRNTERKRSHCATIVQWNWNVNFLLTGTVVLLMLIRCPDCSSG